MKRICRRKYQTIVTVVALLCLCLSGCAPQSPMEKWERSAGLNARETPEELYQKALEEGTLVVYSESTRAWQLKDSFEAAYPGLVVEVHHIRAAELLAALYKNDELQNYHCDVAICTDSLGVVSQELVPAGILHKYVPWDIADHVKAQHNTEMLEYVAEVNQVFYSLDAPEPTSWWALTEPAYYGKVAMANPEKSQSMLSFFIGVMQSGDALEEAYRQRYGEEPPLTQGETAAHLFWRRLKANGLVLTNSGDDVVEQVGSGGAGGITAGFINSGKARNIELGFQAAPAYHMEPFTGIYYPYSVMMAGGSKNTSAAKLFIRWILGEADGAGEGYAIYQKEGVWPVRTDVQTDSSVALEELTLITLDKEAAYRDRETMLELWRSMPLS